ncbi:MAG TPA: siderophore-interacting protein [Acidimicrobiales bacterium]|nr:siderophore-interacting protein [Acidimicrobiales bacterium]
MSTKTAERSVTDGLTRYKTYLTQVSAVADVHDHLRRITFAGGDLVDFAPVGPDMFCYLLLPPPGQTELTIDQQFSWEACIEMPEATRPVGGYYTVREWRSASHELDVLAVLHDHAGPASSWVARAQPGDPVALWGPRTTWQPPADTDRYLLVADETGLPAAAVIIESLPAGTPIRLVAQVVDETTHQDLAVTPTTEVTWLHHRDAPTAERVAQLREAVIGQVWSEGTTYVWGGGESRGLTMVRRYVRDEVGLPAEAVELVAYWRAEA